MSGGYAQAMSGLELGLLIGGVLGVLAGYALSELLSWLEWRRGDDLEAWLEDRATDRRRL